MPSDYLSENEIAAASLRSAGGTFNAQRQQQHIWPAEPVVALAYLDQLQRSEVVSPDRATDLSSALSDAQDRLNEAVSDERVAGKLRSLAVTFGTEAKSLRGRTRDRFEMLSDSLEAIADRL